MSQELETELADRLARAYYAPSALDVSPALLPKSLENAERVQDKLIAQLGSISAWKLGASTPAVRKKNGFDRIFFGALPTQQVSVSPGKLVRTRVRFTGVESEFSFRLGRDLAPRAAQYSATEVREAVAAVVPSLEIPSTRFESIGVHGPFGLVADNGACGCLVLGQEQTDFEPDDLLDTPVTLSIDDSTISSGTGREIIGGPFNAFVDFVNLATSRGYTLKQGQHICTGSCTAYNVVPTGAIATARFGRFGVATVTFVD